MKKRGQQTMGLSFGMIFSIILIVVFIVIAFIAVGFFLDLEKAVNIGTFYDELQSVVNKAWRGQSTETSFSIDLRPNIERVCFANLSARITNPNDYAPIKHLDFYDANVFLIPPEKAQEMEFKLINHLDIARITRTKNPYCVDAFGSLKIKKDFYDKLVFIE